MSDFLKNNQENLDLKVMSVLAIQVFQLIQRQLLSLAFFSLHRPLSSKVLPSNLVIFWFL